MRHIRLASILCLLLAACGSSGDERPVRVDVIGDPKALTAPSEHRGSAPADVMLPATAQGLVAFNVAGEVVPALAQRWIVVDDGRTYIFRLRRARWSNGDRVNAREVRTLLRERFKAAAKDDPYGSIAAVTDVMSMTSDVIEIRLNAPRPSFLVALARPAFTIFGKEGGTGPYRIEGKAGVADEAAEKPRKAGVPIRMKPASDPADEDDPEVEALPVLPIEERTLRVERAAKAVMRFKAGRTDLVLGGTLAEMPFVTLAEIDGDRVRFDPVVGMFGLALRRGNPMFDDDNVRAALNMAIEREAIIAYFVMNRWTISTQIMPQQLDLPQPPSIPAWASMSIDDRRIRAAGVITRWRAQHDDKPVELSIDLPEGPGTELLFLALKAQFRRIGVTLTRAERRADLVLIDEVAPYESASWYLGRISCATNVHCDPDAEELLKQSAAAPTMEERVRLLGQAEPLITAHNGYIPLAAPVRWSLVASRLNGYTASGRASHGLDLLVK